MAVFRACLASPSRWMTGLFLIFLQATTVAAYPSNQNFTAAVSARAGTFYLRILPLGASITWGQASSDGNGYRKHLRDQIRFDGWNVNMVGSRTSGTMNDRVSLIF
jgi:hypothetical protein